MSNGINEVRLLGNLGAKPELTESKGKKPVLKLSVATNESWPDSESSARKEHTEWHQVVTFGARAVGLAKVLEKGTEVHVSGNLRTSKYTDDQGVDRYSTQIISNNIILTGARPATKDSNVPAEAEETA